MKKSIFAIILSLSAASALAGFGPVTVCTNAGNDISMFLDHSRESVVNVKTNGFPEQYQNYNLRDLKVTETVLQTMPTKTKGTSSTTVTFKEIRLEKNDGLAMPDAYGHRAEDDGSLLDYFVCKTTQVWMQ